MDRLGDLTKVLDNKYVLGFLSLMIASYAGFAGPELSPFMRNLFESDAFRMVAVFLVAYMAGKNFQVSVMLAVGLVLSLNYLNEHKMLEGFDCGCTHNQKK